MIDVKIIKWQSVDEITKSVYFSEEIAGKPNGIFYEDCYYGMQTPLFIMNNNGACVELLTKIIPLYLEFYLAWNESEQGPSIILYDHVSNQDKVKDRIESILAMRAFW